MKITEENILNPRFSLKSVFAMFMRAMIGAYGLNVTLHIAAFLLTGERFVPIEFFNTFAQLIWLPTLPLIPICLIWREWRLVGLLLPGVLALLFVWGGMWIPRSAAPADNTLGELPLRLVTYNMLAGNPDTDGYVATIRAMDADIVALQEVTPAHATVLEDAFGDDYPYIAFHPREGTIGQGVMSRYPIDEDTYWRFGFEEVGGTTLGHQRVTMTLNEAHTIVVYNAHPSHPGMNARFFNTDVRSEEIRLVLERAAAETQPVLLVGDFNMPDFSDDYGAIRANFNDAFYTGGVGFGWTFPNNLITENMRPFIRLDYIFHDATFRTVDAVVWSTSAGSDHRPVVADLVFAP